MPNSCNVIFLKRIKIEDCPCSVSDETLITEAIEKSKNGFTEVYICQDDTNLKALLEYGLEMGWITEPEPFTDLFFDGQESEKG